jgi:pimeloyl-ACP methyl ester carboxylesterase
MFGKLKKLRYGARVLLAAGGGQSETVELAGRSIALRHGGEGPPFVYLHSTLGESAMWLPFLQTWSKHFHVFAPMHPGFGKSGGFDEVDTIEDMAFHYIELFDALGLDDIILGGVSLGGWIAAEFAVRWPERVKQLWIADAPGLWLDEKPMPDLFREVVNPHRARKLLFADPNCYVAEMVFQENPDEERLMTGYQNMTALARLVWERPYNPKLARRLKRVQCPTLLLWGAQDHLIPPAYAEAYHACLPHAQVKLIPNCGHLPMFECEEQFVNTVREFSKGSGIPVPSPERR